MRGLLFALGWLFCAEAHAAPSRHLGRLSWLIGAWSFEDRATPAAGFDYVEHGERVCAWALDHRYIECVSSGRTERGQRTYRHFWTWNEDTGRVELVSFFGNTSARGFAFGAISTDGRTIVLTTEPETEDGVSATFRYIIHFDGEASYSWESSRRLGDEGSDQWTTRFIDRAVRLGQ